MVRVEITSKESIKPAIPTPQSHKTLKLSLLDQLTAPDYVPIILFYSSDGNCEVKTKEKVDHLKNSLAETLTQFYPLAGRVKENKFVDCNDEGVEFLEAKVGCPLSKFLQQNEAESLNPLLPMGYNGSQSPTEAQVVIQVSIFSCGGMAIGICILHKLVDGGTLSFLLNSWAVTARGLSRLEPPIFDGPSHFPSRDLSSLLPTIDIPKAKCITKRFVFGNKQLASLKAKVNPKLTRVEVLSSLIWKCALDVSKSQFRSQKPSATTLTVNLRSRMTPTLPENFGGNILWLAISHAPMLEGDVQLHELADRIKNSVRKFDADYVRQMQGEKGFSAIWESLKEIGSLCSKDIDTYRFVSWLNFPFYDCDFGWGRPIWVSSARLVYKNVIILMDNRLGDGIEVWVTLDEDRMSGFERHPKLLALLSSTSND